LTSDFIQMTASHHHHQCCHDFTKKSHRWNTLPLKSIFRKKKSLFSYENLISLCVWGLQYNKLREGYIFLASNNYTKVILHVPSFNQYHFVTVSAYPNRKFKQVVHLHILDMSLTSLPVYSDN